MSASLVGSEMCIRDSTLVPNVGGDRGRTPEVARGRTPEASDFGVHDSESVSYTHLTLPTICSV
eukprot:7054883-Alexandrium_andersonii.AAC.1